MFKNTKTSKKSSIKKDTLIIVQVFVLLLLIFLIINQVETFKNNKAKTREGFQEAITDQVDTVKLHIIPSNDNDDNDEGEGEGDEGDDEDLPSYVVRLGNLDKIVRKGVADNDNISANFNVSTLSTYKLYGFGKHDDGTFKKYDDVNASLELSSPPQIFGTNTITHITIDADYMVILYDGNNFDNNKRSILIKGDDDIIDLNRYNFAGQLSSIKIFHKHDINQVLEREADYNNQILLFHGKGQTGEISRINLPTDKMSEPSKIPYFYTIDANNPIKSIYDIIIPGTDNTTSKSVDEGEYRNINLTLYDKSKNTPIEDITTDKQYNTGDKLKDRTHYIITPQVPTLDTYNALNILKNNMVELTSLQDEFNNIRTEQIETNSQMIENQDKVVDQLSNSFVTKIQTQNNKYNYKLYAQ